MCFQNSEDIVFKFLRRNVDADFGHKFNIYGLTSQMMECIHVNTLRCCSHPVDEWICVTPVGKFYTDLKMTEFCQWEEVLISDLAVITETNAKSCVN